MTERSQVVALEPATEVARGSKLALNSATFNLPPAIDSLLRVSSALVGYGGSFDYPDALKALARLKYERALEFVRPMADKAAAELKPVAHSALIDRLTLLGMSMANGKDADQIRAWLHETARLLAGFPQSVLFEAIDACVTEPGRVFLPSVGEIREKVGPMLRRKELVASRLRYMAKILDEGVELPEYLPPVVPTQFGEPKEPEPPCTGEEAAKILAEFGLPSTHGPIASIMRQAAPMERADYIAEGKMPPPISAEPQKAWDGLP